MQLRSKSLYSIMETATKNSIGVLAISLSIGHLLFISGTSAIRFAGLSSHDIDVTLPADIPKALALPGAAHLVGAYMGKGYQEYTYNGSQWVNTNVRSHLLDKNGKIIGLHQFDPLLFDPTPHPSWISYHNFSYTTGQKVAVVPQDSAVPLVLIQATFASGDPMYFGRTAYVQRLQTVQGLPPDSGMKSTSGQVFQSKYSALYVFYSTIKSDGEAAPNLAPAPAPTCG